MIVTLDIKCANCPKRDHSGAFTPGGAKDVCGHPMAVEFFTNEDTGERFHWKHRVVDVSAEPPEQCPIRNGAGL